MPTHHVRASTPRGIRFLVAVAFLAAVALVPGTAWADSSTSSAASSSSSAPGLSFIGIFPQCSGGFLQGLTVLFGSFPGPSSSSASQLPLATKEVAALQTTGTGTHGTALLASPQQVTSNQVFLPVLIPSAPSGSGILILGNPQDVSSLLTLLAGGGSPPAFPGLQGFSFNCGLPTLPPPPTLPGPGAGMAAPGGGATPNGNGAVGQNAVPTTPFATAQPVSYLGYAPTGSRSASSPVGLLPLVAVGAGLLAAGSALTAHRVRARANRSKG